MANNENKNKGWFWQILSQNYMKLCNNTCMHALKLSADPESPTTDRIYWLSWFLLGLTVAIVVSIGVWMEWGESPVAVTLDANEHNHIFPFPAVTVCAANKVSKSKLEALRSKHYPHIIYEDIKHDLSEIIRTTARAQPNPSNAQPETNFHTDLAAGQLVDMFKTTAPSCEEIIAKSYWQGDLYNGKITATPTSDGLCCTFNGFLSNSSEKPLDINGHGHNSGVTLVLQPNKEDIGVKSPNYKSWYDANDEWSFMVLVHRPDEYPDVTMSLGIKVQKSTELDVVFRVDGFKHTEALHKVPKEKRQCVLQDELDDKFTYNQAECQVNCAAEHVFNKCGCSPYLYHISNGSNLCNSLDKLTCSQKEWLAHFRSSNLTAEKTCTCPPICFTDSYETIVDRRELQNTVDASAYVNVFFSGKSSLTETNTKHNPFTFTLAVFGMLGVAFGFSIVSIGEIIFYIFKDTTINTIKHLREKQENEAHQKTPV